MTPKEVRRHHGEYPTYTPFAVCCLGKSLASVSYYVTTSVLRQHVQCSCLCLMGYDSLLQSPYHFVCFWCRT